MRALATLFGRSASRPTRIVPGPTDEEFLLLLPLTHPGRKNYAAWMAAWNDGEPLNEVRIHRFPAQHHTMGPALVHPLSALHFGRPALIHDRVVQVLQFSYRALFSMLL